MKQGESTNLSTPEPPVTYNGNGATLKPTLKPNEQETEPVIEEDTATSNNTVVEQQENIDEDEAVDENKQHKSRKHRKWILLLGGAITFAVAGVFGLRWWQFESTHVSTDNAQIDGHLSPVSARISATVQQVLVKEGERVKLGQPLVVLENQDLNLQAHQAEANLANAKAQLQKAADTVSVTRQTNPTQVQQAQAKLAASVSAVKAAQANVNQAQAKIETNQANVAQAQTEVNKTQADFRRYQALYREGAISAQQFDTAQAGYKNAEAGLVAAQKSVAQTQAELINAQAQLQTAQAQVEQAKGQVQETQISGQNLTVQKDELQAAQAQMRQADAALALARQQLEYTRIYAPVTGFIGRLTAQVGQKVQIAQPLLSVVPLQTDEVYVEANLKETALGRVHIGQKADVEVDAYPGETFHAHVAGISPATGSSFALIPPDNATGNFNKVVQWVPIRLVFDSNTDPEHKLRPGLNVTVIVDTTSVAKNRSTNARY
ncbi:HlyD family secretion protein [Brasilonema sp. CT11]|nr:HlyD family secretion protein [Brasilonema sp. CT11]